MISVVVLDNTNIVVAIIINDFNSYCGMLLDIGLNWEICSWFDSC